VQAQIEERAKKYSTTIEDETFNLLAEKQPSKQFVHPEVGSLVDRNTAQQLVYLVPITGHHTGPW
jgi:hypothetical protein